VNEPSGVGTASSVPEVRSPKRGMMPPQSVEAEISVLGGLLLDPDSVAHVADILEPADFYRREHHLIYSAMLNLFNRNEPIDLITLAEELKELGHLESVGGEPYLYELAEAVPTAAHVRYYAKIVKEKALLRQLIGASTEIIESCYQPGQEAEDLLDEAERKIFAIADRQIKEDFVDANTLAKLGMQRLDELATRSDSITGISTGFTDLDQITAGFQRSDFIVVAARPSMGKTALCLNIAHHVAEKERKVVAFFSLEMPKEQLVLRMFASSAKVDFHKVRTGMLTDEDYEKIAKTAASLSTTDIYFDDTPALSVMELRAKARRLQAEKRLDMVIIDYLQLMRGRRGNNEASRQQEISEISRGLKALAKELKVPVVAISQLSRAVEGRQDKRPQLSDLRESGAIEQDADLVIFVYREDAYKKDTQPSQASETEVIIGKQRNGPMGTIKLTFLKRFVRFENYAPESITEGVF
jgi:replicative DNA helicase